MELIIENETKKHEVGKGGTKARTLHIVARDVYVHGSRGSRWHGSMVEDYPWRVAVTTKAQICLTNSHLHFPMEM